MRVKEIDVLVIVAGWFRLGHGQDMRWFLCFLGLVGSTELQAQVHSAPTGLPSTRTPHTRIDPTFEFLKVQVERYGRAAPAFGTGLPAHLPLDGTAALLEFDEVLDDLDIRQLTSVGIIFPQPARHIGTIYSAWLPFTALKALENHPKLRRAEATWTPFILHPLDVTADQIGAIQQRMRPILGFDGTGVLIANIDSGIDPTHPHFFRADGGHFRWIDTNKNGVFDSGQDAADLNQNGRADTNETLLLLDGAGVHNGQTSNADGVFQPTLDWLFTDQNSDKIRNTGLDEGFVEEDLAWGEPIFVVDDVNGNDVLDPNELLIRLGTSKVRAFVTPSSVYERGRNLIDAPKDQNFDLVYHGTGVASILLGGQAPHTRQGVAPGAELITYATGEATILNQNFDTNVPFDALADAIARGATIVLHEWTDPFRAAQDGSTLFEAALTTSRAQGLVHVTPAGNLNQSGKHVEISAQAGIPTELPFEVPASSGALNSAFGSLMWNGPAANIEITRPDGARVEVPAGEPVEIETGLFIQTTLETTSRGFSHLQFLAWSDNGPLSPGTWSLFLTMTTSTTIFGRITDYLSGWGVGVGWKEPTVDRGTLVFPSTADVAIAVAAFAGRWDGNGNATTAGEIRAFSGRGPRMDGARSLDISAPDDPFAAISATSQFLEAGYERQWFATFGGTSGAGPHVAGAFALLQQAFRQATPDELELKLLSNATATQLDPTFGAEFPNSTAGHGRLDVFASLSDQAPTPTSNRPPEVQAFVENVGGEARLRAAAVDPDGDEVWYRFDANHDGVYDSDWTLDSIWRGQTEPAEFARIQARDVYGASRGVVIAWDTPQTQTDMGPDQTDMGTPSTPPTQTCGGCGTPSSPASVLWLAALLGFRRKRS